MPYNKCRNFLTSKVKKPKSCVSRHKLLHKSTAQLTIDNRSIIKEAEFAEKNETIDIVNFNLKNVEVTSFFII